MLTILAKVWAWIKAYWYIPIAAVFVIVMYSERGALKNILKLAMDSHKKQLDEINRLEKERREAKEAALDKYNETIDELRFNHNIKIGILSAKKKKLVKDMVEKYTDEELARELSKEFNVDYEGQVK